ncbi:MAG: hypothetical protein IJ711_08365 [Lachnospiraceae bacterium]|nr:hypothetical protein [Lachnospiraceae bacterium]
MRQKEKPYNWIGIVLLFVVSAFGIWKTVFLSADIDESYAVTLGIRLAHGDRLFKDMWEVHQTSAVLYAPAIFLYEKLTGGVEGLLIFLRLLGTAVSLTLSVYGYLVMRRWVNPSFACFLSALYFNFTPKQIQSPEFTQLLYWGIFLLGLALLEHARTARKCFAIVTAVSLCVCVLAYPYAVWLFPVCLLILWQPYREGGTTKWREFGVCAALFTLVCAGLGALFILYVLSGVSVKELIGNVPYVLMDASHEQSFRQMWRMHIVSLGEMLYPTFLIMLIAQVSMRIDKKRAGARSRFTIAAAAAAQAAAFVWQFHTIRKVNFTILLPLILQLLCFLGYAYWILTREDLLPEGAAKADLTEGNRTFLLAIGVPSVCATLTVLSSSNLTANYSMGFLLPALLALCMASERTLVRICAGQRAGREKALALSMRLLVLVFGILLLTTRVFLVRFTSTQRKNVFEGYYKTTHGPLKGIRLGENDYRQYEAKTAALREQVSEDDVFLYVGCDLFLYSQLPCRIGTGNTISTPAFGEQLLAYYEKYPDRIPTVMFVDRGYVADFSQELEKEPFKSFVEARYVRDESVTDAPVSVYRLREEPQALFVK